MVADLRVKFGPMKFRRQTGPDLSDWNEPELLPVNVIDVLCT